MVMVIIIVTIEIIKQSMIMKILIMMIIKIFFLED